MIAVVPAILLTAVAATAVGLTLWVLSSRAEKKEEGKGAAEK